MPNNQETGKLLSVAEVAQRAGVSQGLVRAWVHSGDLAHYRLGARGKRGKIAVAEADLEAFLQARRVSVTPPSPPAPAASRGRRGDDDFSAYYQRIMDEVARKCRR